MLGKSRRNDCGISSRCWYISAFVVFVIWITTSVVAKGGEDPTNIRETLREFFASKRIVPRLIVSKDDNPAPSVVLEVTSAPWCGPCRVIKPILKKMEKEGYKIKITVLDNPGKSVPYFEWKHFGKLELEHAGVEGYPDLKKAEATLRETFREIEGSIFQEAR